MIIHHTHAHSPHHTSANVVVGCVACGVAAYDVGIDVTFFVVVGVAVMILLAILMVLVLIMLLVLLVMLLLSLSVLLVYAWCVCY